MFAIRTKKDVLIYTVVFTLIAVIASGFAVFLPFAAIGMLQQALGAMLLAMVIAGFIAAPISFIALLIVRKVDNAVRKLEDFVKFDQLTGVLARSYFLEHVRQRFADGGALFLVDADHFKKINDTYGHDVGDMALRIIGETLNFNTGKSDAVGRIGGEEFAVFLRGASDDEIIARAEQIRVAMAEKGKVIGGHEINLTVSIGIAKIKKGSTLTVIFKEADENLYTAKNSGRNQFVYGSSDLELTPAFANAG